MSIIGSNILAGASGQATGYNLNNSLRFRQSANGYLSRTPSSATNRRTWTWSGWVKLGTLGTDRMLFSAGSGATDSCIYFSYGNLFFFNTNNASNIYTTQVFRDPSAWYHVVAAFDTTQATAANRVKIYINGNAITAFSSSYPTQNTDGGINNNIQHLVGGYAASPSVISYDGYMTEVNFVDGQQLTPSSFGETDTTTGVWKPKAYTSTYGTNGFYLKFSDIATTSGSNAGLGKDFSGNTNYWTTNNISVTAGTTYDAMIDSPTLTSATVANYATLNPLDKNFGNAGSIVDGNLGTTSQTSTVPSTFYLSTGKWYFEASFSSITGASSLVEVGIRNGTSATGQIQGYKSDGNKDVETSATAYGATYTTGDIIGCAFDLDAKSMTFYKNGTSQGSFTYTTVDLYTPCLIARGTTTYTGTINFGQRPFTYTPPTGFVRLNTYNLPTPTILQGNKYMDATLYTGTGATQVVTNSGSMKPDLVWLKSRSVARDHRLMDTVRGINLGLQSDLTSAEFTGTALSSINSNGFTLNTTDNQNVSAETYVGWQWQAGQGSSSSNTSGTITSTVSVNATAGFSIVTYTGNGGSNVSIGHGLGVTPVLVLTKDRTSTGVWDFTYTFGDGSYDFLELNTTAAKIDISGRTAPTSSLFYVNGSNSNVSARNYVSYIWAEIAGFSKFGSYTGNGSADGPFVYLGFRPKYVLVKNSQTGGSWVIHDTSRNTYNVADSTLYPNYSNAEASADAPFDILSNGFKFRGTGVNNSGETHIYMAFAESPFKSSLAR